MNDPLELVNLHVTLQNVQKLIDLASDNELDNFISDFESDHLITQHEGILQSLIVELRLIVVDQQVLTLLASYLIFRRVLKVNYQVQVLQLKYYFLVLVSQSRQGRWVEVQVPDRRVLEN